MTARVGRRRELASPRLKVTLMKSLIGLSPKQEACVRALGLRRIGQTATHHDTETTRGMIAKVRHVLEVRHET
jgi:large subunit ribosomal protein L30